MTLERLLRCGIGFGLALMIDGLLAQAVNTALIAPMLAPSADGLAHALIVLAVGAAAAGGACQIVAGQASLAPYAVAAAILGAGLVWVHGAPGELKLFLTTFTFAGAGATLLAAVGADRLRGRL